MPHSAVPSWYFSLVDSCPRRLNAATGTKPKKGYFLFVRDLFFGKNLVYCYCDWQKTAWKDNKSEATTVRRLHIWIFSSLRIWAHLILQQESWKAQHKVRAMRDLYMKNTLSQRDIQSFFSQEILFYTNMAGGKKLAYEDDENSHKNSVPASFHLFSCYQFQVEQSFEIVSQKYIEEFQRTFSQCFTIYV